MNYGTNQPEEIKLPISTDLVKTVEMVYAQDGMIVLRKTEADVTMKGQTITIPFTEAETFKFNENIPVKSQLRIVTIYDEVLKTRIYTQHLDGTISEEVLT